MNKTVIGVCNLCGGKVSTRLVWHGIIPPPPTCESCGATIAQFATPMGPLPILNMRTYGPVVTIKHTPSTGC